MAYRLTPRGLRNVKRDLERGRILRTNEDAFRRGPDDGDLVLGYPNLQWLRITGTTPTHGYYPAIVQLGVNGGDLDSNQVWLSFPLMYQPLPLDVSSKRLFLGRQDTDGPGGVPAFVSPDCYCAKPGYSGSMSGSTAGLIFGVCPDCPVLPTTYILQVAGIVPRAPPPGDPTCTACNSLNGGFDLHYQGTGGLVVNGIQLTPIGCPYWTSSLTTNFGQCYQAGTPNNVTLPCWILVGCCPGFGELPWSLWSPDGAGPGAIGDRTFSYSPPWRCFGVNNWIGNGIPFPALDNCDYTGAVASVYTM